jgi:hypothetical protein
MFPLNELIDHQNRAEIQRYGFQRLRNILNGKEFPTKMGAFKSEITISPTLRLRGWII